MFGCEYETGLIGKLILASDGEALVGCWFENDRFAGFDAAGPLEPCEDLPVFVAARAWLDRYFAGKRPDPAELPLKPSGTPFQLEVWRMLGDIPYGQTVTYGDIARRFEAERGRRMSAQAVGGAVGRNPLCVIVPCHRVMGAGGNLTGFGGGIPTKVRLLEHEKADMQGFYVPKKGSAL